MGIRSAESTTPDSHVLVAYAVFLPHMPPQHAAIAATLATAPPRERQRDPVNRYTEQLLSALDEHQWQLAVDAIEQAIDSDNPTVAELVDHATTWRPSTTEHDIIVAFRQTAHRDAARAVRFARRAGRDPVTFVQLDGNDGRSGGTHAPPPPPPPASQEGRDRQLAQLRERVDELENKLATARDVAAQLRSANSALQAQKATSEQRAEIAWERERTAREKARAADARAGAFEAELRVLRMKLQRTSNRYQRDTKAELRDALQEAGLPATGETWAEAVALLSDGVSPRDVVEVLAANDRGHDASGDPTERRRQRSRRGTSLPGAVERAREGPAF